MNTLRYALWLYRLWKPSNGRFRAAVMAFNEARKPQKLEK